MSRTNNIEIMNTILSTNIYFLLFFPRYWMSHPFVSRKEDDSHVTLNHHHPPQLIMSLDDHCGNFRLENFIPLARRALPDAVTLNINIAAPKVWFSLSNNPTDSAVFLDAGKFLVLVLSKTDDVLDTVWMFVRRQKNRNHRQEEPVITHLGMRLCQPFSPFSSISKLSLLSVIWI